jgi:myo-inositol-1(or 4)-monophosphatase
MPVDPVLLATAVEAVLKAGEIQMAHFGRAMRIEKKGSIDLVTEVDLEVERMCRRVLAERFPSHAILAEEFDPEPGRGALSSHCWVFDPIDGTTNFAHGLPIFCASLGLEIDGQAVLGAVYDPSRHELFTAERGGGAFLNGQRLHVSETPTLIDAMLCTGFPYDVHLSREEIIGLFSAFVGRARAVRRLGSAALDLCYVAAGRFDGFWEQRLHPWDTSAATLVIEEAGGRTSRFDGSPFQSRHDNLVATNRHVHDQMLSVIADCRAGRS